MKWIFKDGQMTQIIDDLPLLPTIEQLSKLEDLRFNYVLPTLMKLQETKKDMNSRELDQIERDLKAAYDKLCRILKMDNLLFI